MIFFPHVDAYRPLEDAEEIAKFRAAYGGEGRSAPGTKVPCLVNPQYADQACIGTPAADDDCSPLVGAPPSCAACVNRVFIGSKEEVNDFVWARIGTSLLVATIMIVCFLPVGGYLCACAFPRWF